MRPVDHEVTCFNPPNKRGTCPTNTVSTAVGLAAPRMPAGNKRSSLAAPRCRVSNGLYGTAAMAIDNGKEQFGAGIKTSVGRSELLYDRTVVNMTILKAVMRKDSRPYPQRRAMIRSA